MVTKQIKKAADKVAVAGVKLVKFTVNKPAQYGYKKGRSKKK